MRVVEEYQAPERVILLLINFPKLLFIQWPAKGEGHSSRTAVMEIGARRESDMGVS